MASVTFIYAKLRIKLFTIFKYEGNFIENRKSTHTFTYRFTQLQVMPLSFIVMEKVNWPSIDYM